MSNESKCSCQHCSGNISFPTEMAGQMIPCPHCGLETKLCVPAISKDIQVEIKRGASPLGIAALVLGIISCLFCWIPFLGLLAVPLALIGLLLGIVGLIMAGINKKTGFIFPISGLVICLLSMFIAFVVTGGVTMAFQRAVVAANQTNQKSEPNSANTKPNSVTETKIDPEPTAEQWSKSLTVRQGDVQISIAPHIASVLGNPLAHTGPLAITIVVKNLSDTKKIDFTSWGAWNYSFDAPAASPSTLTDSHPIQDNFQNKYGQYENIELSSHSIYPSNLYSEDLIFEAPVKNIQWLHLELPAKNFGGEGMIRFEILASEIKSK